MVCIKANALFAEYIDTIKGKYMKKLKKITKELWSDESGQGATEYILLLVVVVAVGLLFGESIKDAVTSKLQELSSGIANFK